MSLDLNVFTDSVNPKDVNTVILDLNLFRDLGGIDLGINLKNFINCIKLYLLKWAR